ncbi:MAG: tetratricopeptide repeat protein [Bryobacteraceae bacterium]
MRWLVVFAALSLFAQEDDAIARHGTAAATAMRSGDYAAAERQDRIILRLQPQMAEAEMNLGLACFLQKKYEDAIQAFEAGLKLKPDMANADLFLGISRFQLNQVPRAIPSLQRYVTQHPDDVQGQYYLGLSYLALKRYPEAGHALTAAHHIDGRNIDALYHLSQVYLGEARKNPKNKDALERSFQETINEITAIDPNTFRLGQIRAAVYEADGKKAEAIHELETLFEHDPKARGLHYTLGCLYIEQRQYEKAREQLEKELQLGSPYPRTYLQLGHVFVELNKPAQALPLLDRSLKIDPDSGGVVWADIGRAYRIMNQPGKAAAAYEKAIALGQKTSSVYYQLAMVARKTGDAARSREALAISQRLRSEEKQTQSPAPQ